MKKISLALLVVIIISLVGCSTKSSEDAYRKGVEEAQKQWSAETVEIDEEKRDKLAENVAKNRKDYQKKIDEAGDLKAYDAQQNEKGDTVDSEGKIITYILNINTGQFHTTTCDLLKGYSLTSLRNFYLTRTDALGAGYQPCTECKP